MSKCPGCHYYVTACQCRKDDNYCSLCKRIISDCKCTNHSDHYRYDNPSTYKFDNDDPCNIENDDNNNSGDGGSVGSGNGGGSNNSGDGGSVGSGNDGGDDDWRS